ncbi:Vacuolar protein sorting-associated protein 41 [Zea mays]|uniref:Vacuolar protein sorting-associated protein 41 n=1 Tax=Zea mays TaxID=4577 RepID=A0A3L6D611_MAIZE|nr:Vacuolar protein sorting-associated protein 41 [Zea mays]
MVRNLLEHTIGNLDPLYIVTLVPDGLELTLLRNRLVKIMTGYQTETSLRNGCIDILKADCVNLLVKYYHEARRGGTHGKHMDEETVCKNQVEQSLLITGFGYEHDDARMTNINLFKEFTALSRICTSEFSYYPVGAPFWSD